MGPTGGACAARGLTRLVPPGDQRASEEQMATRRRRRKSQAMRDDAQDDLYGNDGDRARGSGSESEVDSDNDGDDDGESTLTGPGESLTGGACVEIQISELIGAQMGKSKEPVSQD